MHAKVIGLVAHTGKPGVGDLINSIVKEFERFSISILLEKETAAIAGGKSDHSIAQLGAEVDLMVVVGGDGTILHVVGQLGDVVKPIFGINVGSLGFLTCANSSGYREAGVLVITPICPHVLTNRSIIVAETSLIEIEVSDPDYPVFLTLDGRPPIRVKRGSTITIRRAKKTLPLAALPDVSFFNVVRQKLKWSGSNV